MLSSTLQFHCREAHGYWTGDIRDIRALRRHHAQMHETEWANPDTTPHTHQAGRTGLSWAEVTEAEDG
jgi:hypothetical protein